MRFEDINKNLVNVTYKAGLKINVEIVNLAKISDINISDHSYLANAPPEVALMKIIFDQNVILETYEPILVGFWVTQTIDDRSYWEDIAKNSDDKHKSSVVGDLFVTEYESGISKRNWKTGWVEYYYMTSSNSTSLIYECEISSENDSNVTSGFPFFLTYLLFLGMILALPRRRK